MENRKPRAKWSGQLAFVLAGAASAVGLGNLWRFPYLAAQYGGGIFLVTYLALVVTFGFSLMVAEIAIGRRTGLSGLAAFKTLDRRFGFLGWIVTAIPVIILPYYCVIGGWVVGPKLVLDEASIPTPFRRRRLFVAMVRYVAPILLLAILASSILNALGIVVI